MILRRQVLTPSMGALLAILLAISANAQAAPDFTGRWVQQTNPGEQRQLDIAQSGKTLRVKTTVTTSKGTRRLEVSYQFGGPETVYKGLDGDEFHSRIHWDGSALIFDIVEHEGLRRIPETTIWTLSEDRNSLVQKRHSTKSGKDSSATYVRLP
jgi:hypothetical protein